MLTRIVSLTAILVYRVFRNESKRNVKILHAVLHLLALIISIVGKACVGVYGQDLLFWPFPLEPKHSKLI